jgi:hypothetical protein
VYQKQNKLWVSYNAAPLALIACIGVGLGGIAGLTAGLAFGSGPVIVRALRTHSAG